MKTIKLNVYNTSELEMLKTLPFCGGATIIHRSECGTPLYYTIFLKPRNIVERIWCKYVLENTEYTFVQENKAA